MLRSKDLHGLHAVPCAVRRDGKWEKKSKIRFVASMVLRPLIPFLHTFILTLELPLSCEDTFMGLHVHKSIGGWGRRCRPVVGHRVRAGSPAERKACRRIRMHVVDDQRREPVLGGTPPPEAEQFMTMGGGTVDVVEPAEAEVDIFGELSTGNLHFTEEPRPYALGKNVLGLQRPDEIHTLPAKELQTRVGSLLTTLGISPSPYPHGQPQRAIYCSRTLNLRSIQAIGFDMDYTLVHYDVNMWEGRAYAYGMAALSDMGVPVDGLRFNADLVIRGLILDTELGNIVKADRFGFVKRAMHGTRMLSPAAVRAAYGRELVNLRNESRWVFLNTLFSVSEAVMFAQLVDRLDAGFIPQQVCPASYAALYKLVSKALFMAHVEGRLKAEIKENPEKFIQDDPELPRALLDLRQSGKSLLLITNSDLEYTEAVMKHAQEPYLPAGMKWRDLFDYIIVNARKPDFFRSSQVLYEVVTPDGLMRPANQIARGGLYNGGCARMVESALGIAGDDILYVGDHIYTDAALAKLEFNWRTCLVVRELEQEIEALAAGRAHRDRLREALKKKDLVGDAFNNLRLARQRSLAGVSKTEPGPHLQSNNSQDEMCVNEALAELLLVMEELDRVIGPAIEQDGAGFNSRWGYLSRAGVNDRSQLLRQIEKYADIYTSRVSNFLRYSPFCYFRAPAQSILHDRPTSDERVLANKLCNGNGSQDVLLSSPSPIQCDAV